MNFLLYPITIRSPWQLLKLFIYHGLPAGIDSAPDLFSIACKGWLLAVLFTEEGEYSRREDISPNEWWQWQDVVCQPLLSPVYLVLNNLWRAGGVISGRDNQWDQRISPPTVSLLIFNVSHSSDKKNEKK